MLDALALGSLVTRELLLVAAVGLALSGLDDLFVDFIYFARRGWRALTVYRRFPRAHADEWAGADPGWMAIIVPAWDEAAVIGAMLADMTRRLEYPRYRVFVGVYPNDPSTRAAVDAVNDPRIIVAVTDRPGPTSKADCLNRLWQAVLAHERGEGIRFKAVVLHDAEDVVHRHELKVYDRLIPRFALVQLPVLPLPDPGSRWVAGHYLDEFAESHTKDVVVREALGAAVPSAGVGCAIERGMLGRVADESGGAPFDPRCFTEDYELGMRVADLGGRGVMVRVRGGPERVVVATQEHFPATLGAAVRQKSRWLLGIALAGWDRLGWRGNLADRYMLWRDRKPVFTAPLLLLAYVTLVLGAIVLAAAELVPGGGGIPPVTEPDSLLALLLMFNGGLLAWRLLMRSVFTGAAYGWREGVRAAPRAIVANMINLAASWRAFRRYVGTIIGRHRPVWEKTAHRFPAELAPTR